MTYLLELTIRKIYTDHKFAKSLLAADQSESWQGQPATGITSPRLQGYTNNRQIVLGFSDKLWMFEWTLR